MFGFQARSNTEVSVRTRSCARCAYPLSAPFLARRNLLFKKYPGLRMAQSNKFAQPSHIAQTNKLQANQVPRSRSAPGFNLMPSPNSGYTKATCICKSFGLSNSLSNNPELVTAHVVAFPKASEMHWHAATPALTSHLVSCNTHIAQSARNVSPLPSFIPDSCHLRRVVLHGCTNNVLALGSKPASTVQHLPD